MPVRDSDLALHKRGSMFDHIHERVAATPVPRHLDRLVHDSLGPGGRPRKHARYPSHALLVGLVLLVWLRRPLTLTGLRQLFWEELTPEQRTRLGLDPVVTPERRALYQRPAGQDREYNRLQRDFDAMIATFDPSPFAAHRADHRKQRLTVGQRKAVLRALTEREREQLARKERRLDWVMNTLLGAFVGDRPDDYDGSLVGDATIVGANASTNSTGYKQDHLPYGADLDAIWWDTSHVPADGTHGSTAAARRRGAIWGFAIHLTQRTHLLYQREVAKVATGICITHAVGGSTEGALRAVRGHVNNGQGPLRGKQADAIWDNGYTNLNGLAAGHLDLGYRVVRDYNAGQRPVHRSPATGILLWQGAELCPGALAVIEPFTENKEWQRYPDDNASDAKIEAHNERMKHVLAFRLATNGVIRNAPLKPATEAKRKERKQPHGPYVASRSCPARAGTCACPLVPTSLNKGLPLVPVPPVPVKDATGNDNPGYAICGEKSYTEVRYDETEFKFLNPYVVGTEEHADRYNGSRSRNEAYHALLKSPETGNLRPEAFDLHGLARVGLLVTAAAIVTNIRSLAAFDKVVRNSGGQAPYEDRRSTREARRTRAHAYRGRRHAPLLKADEPAATNTTSPLLVQGDRRRKPRP